MKPGSGTQYWHCMEPACAVAGVGDKDAETHTKATSHPTFTTTRPDWPTSTKENRR